MRTKVRALVIGFGTDTLGRDILYARYVRRSHFLNYRFCSGFHQSCYWCYLYGGIAGYLGGKVDRIMMGIVDVFVRYSTFTLRNFVDGCTWPWFNVYFRSIGHCVLAQYGPYRTQPNFES